MKFGGYTLGEWGIILCMMALYYLIMLNIWPR